MVTRILDITSGANTGDQGQAVLADIQDILTAGKSVTISFAGVHTATSSFVNAAFVPLLQRMTLDELKRRMRVIDSTRQINDMIKWRLERAASSADRSANRQLECPR
jgi:hypothetical protein